jgi:ComF family protein
MAGALHGAATLLYPSTCIGCGLPCRDGFDALCWDCLAGAIYLTEPWCARCGEPVEGRVDHTFTCHLCGTTDRGFDRARSAVRHDGVMREALHRFKYRRALWLRDDLVRLLYAAYRRCYGELPIDAVTWVPLHRVRRRERGYNQARVLAEGLARRSGLPPAVGALRRTRPTESQTGLTAAQRIPNVRRAFGARSRYAFGGARLLLVDDVMTTGATVGECARCLREAGAAHVYVLTFARG